MSDASWKEAATQIAMDAHFTRRLLSAALNEVVDPSKPMWDLALRLWREVKSLRDDSPTVRQEAERPTGAADDDERAAQEWREWICLALGWELP